MGKFPAVEGLPAVGRRWVMIGLRQSGMSPSEVRKTTGMRLDDQEKWLRRFSQTGKVESYDGQGRRTDRAEIIQRTKDKLKELLKAEHKDTRASKLLAKHVEVGARQVRRVLRQPGVSNGWHNMSPVPRMSDSCKAKRLAFARANRDRGWRKVVFTDSKIFVAEMDSNMAKKIYCWHPHDRRREAEVNKHSAQIHMYGAVCYYGSVLLVQATGTTGVVSKYVYVNGKRKGQAMRGVGAEEYMDIFDELHARVNDLYEEQGIHDWWWQQDGATAHTAKAATAHVRAIVPHFLENWPPNSPDLSWIENIWAIVEKRLWNGSKQWHNLVTFETALRETWHEVTGDKDLMHKMSNGMRRRMRTLIENDGAKLKY